MLQTALAKLLTLKVGAGVLAVTATGGVAVAAANGTLPSPMTEPSAKPSAHATGKPATTGKKSVDPSPAGAKASPSPSLVGLCRAFTAGAGDNPGKALENPAFTVLITTAGGKERVAAYCDTLLEAAKGTPGRAPSARPSANATHPGGRPESRPTPAGNRPTDAGASRKPVAPATDATS